MWPDTFVEEGALTQNISLLRKALNETPQDRYIETIPKRGYRFIAPVCSNAPVATAERSILVLPLVNLSPDPAQEFFADGMTDELISQLMRTDSLRVVSRTTAMTYKEGNKSIRRIAEELKADWVVEGAVLHSGNRVRISARLIDASTERNLWAQSYERDVRNVLELQSDVAGAITREIRMKVTPDGQRPAAAIRPVDPKAYVTYLRARYFWNKRTVEDIRRSITYFRQSIDQDPTYSPAYAGLSDAYALLGSMGFDAMPPREALPLAKAAANQAVHLDELSAEAHASLAHALFVFDWDWQAAEKEFRLAISLNPHYPPTHEWYGHLLLTSGRVSEAHAEFTRALELDPLSVPHHLALGYWHYCVRNHDKAIEQYKKVLELAPNTPFAFYELSLAYQQQQRFNEALLAAQQATAIPGAKAASLVLSALAKALAGRTPEAYADLQQLQELSKHQYVPAVYMAGAYANLGEKDESIKWLEQAYQDRANYVVFLAVEPSFDSLRSDPRFVSLLRRIGLKIA